MFHVLAENAVYTQLLAPASRSESGGSSGVYTSSYIPANDAEYIEFLVNVGDVTAGDTVDFVVLKATDSSGTNATTVTGAAITQLDANDDNKLAAVTIRTNVLGQTSSGVRFTHVAGRLTIAGSSAAVLCAVTSVRYHVRTAPPSDDGLEESVLVVS